MLKRLLRPTSSEPTRAPAPPEAWWLWLSAMPSAPSAERSRLALADLRSRP